MRYLNLSKILLLTIPFILLLISNTSYAKDKTSYLTESDIYVKYIDNSSNNDQIFHCNEIYDFIEYDELGDNLLAYGDIGYAPQYDPIISASATCAPNSEYIPNIEVPEYDWDNKNVNGLPMQSWSMRIYCNFPGDTLALAPPNQVILLCIDIKSLLK